MVHHPAEREVVQREAADVVQGEVRRDERTARWCRIEIDRVVAIAVIRRRVPCAGGLRDTVYIHVRDSGRGQHRLHKPAKRAHDGERRRGPIANTDALPRVGVVAGIPDRETVEPVPARRCRSPPTSETRCSHCRAARRTTRRISSAGSSVP